MKLRVVISKDASFANFLRIVMSLEKWPGLKTGLFAKIPPALIKKAGKFLKLTDKLSFEKHPKYDLKSKGDLDKVISEVQAIHDAIWKERILELNEFQVDLQNLLRIYGVSITNYIKSETKIDWATDRIEIIPSIYEGGAAVKGKVFVGLFQPKPHLLATLIHEMIHINTPWTKKESKLKYQDSREIAVTLITNKTIDRLNKKFRTKEVYQDWDLSYSSKVKALQEELYDIGAEKKSYHDILSAVDTLLARKKYKPAFK